MYVGRLLQFQIVTSKALNFGIYEIAHEEVFFAGKKNMETGSHRGFFWSASFALKFQTPDRGVANKLFVLCLCI